MSDLMLDVDQAGELKAAFRRGGWTNQEIKRLCEGSILADVRRVLLGTNAIVDRQYLDHIKELAEAVVSRPRIVEAALDTLIRVDRSTRPLYPDWVDEKSINDKKFIALEKTGPSEYGLSTLEQWLHDSQKNGGRCKGEIIFDHLRNNMLERCLGLADLLAIQKLGIEAFRKYFKDKAVFGWKSVVRDRYDVLRVPCLVESFGQVKLFWFWLDDDWDGVNLALRFAS